MDDVKHLYTVLAILGFLSLPVVMNSEKVLPLDMLRVRSAEPFNVDKVFPAGRRAVDPVPAASTDVLPAAANTAIPQRWIDHPMAASCKRVATAVAVAKPAHAATEPCLIV